MRPEAVDFLKDYLTHHPELRRTIRIDPPSVRLRKGWKRIDRLHLLSSGIQLRLSGGARIRLFPAKRRRSKRARYAAQILRLLQRRFRGWKAVRILEGTDRTRHQTAALLRILFWDGKEHVAALVVYPDESAKLADRLFSSALLWWDRLHTKGKAKRVFILLPESFSERLVGRFPKVKIPLVCYKYDLIHSTLRQVYPHLVGSSRLKSPYVIFPYSQEIPPLLDRITKRNSFLTLTYRKGRWEVSYLGLRIAWYIEDRKRYFFDLQRPKILTSSANADFESYLQEVVRFRSFPPPQPEHFLYRFGHERWLESLVLRDHTLLNPNFVKVAYPQVPTCLDGERKVLDLLTATAAGQVAVLELKVHQDLDLLFQGLDYWERVSYHLKRRDFQQAGYFKGIVLSQKPPLLYLVCPLFEFHRVMPVLRRHLSDELVIQCVGINSDWKGGVKILRKFDF